MALDHFPLQSADWCRDKLRALADQEVAGKISTNAGAGDISGSFQVEAGSVAIRRKLIESLMVKDPDGGWSRFLPAILTRGIFRPPVETC